MLVWGPGRASVLEECSRLTVLLSSFARDWLCILGQAASWDFLPSVSITLTPAFFQPAFGDQISTAWYQVHVSRLFFHRFEVSDQMMLP